MYCGVLVLGWYMYSALVGGLLVVACVGVFGRCCWVVLLALVRGLTFLACACAFDGFLL